YDEDRVYVSDIKKIVQWYNILQGSGIMNFTVEETENKKNTKETSKTAENPKPPKNAPGKTTVAKKGGNTKNAATRKT
ncbi:MAG TPA: hypothetical protein VFD80_02630, partial [Flavobacteriaceae bacterium]|nr:hypothetical protein [Flavobacteriaceae bacterium]